MSGFLRELLDAEEPLFSLSLRQLERESGEQARDARLVGDITAKMNAAIRALGLDPADTTGPELYAALMARFAADNARVARLLGGSGAETQHAMALKIIEAIESLPIVRTCWVLKRSAAKRLLKAMPPKQLMKHLGYRSIDSMLKHEPIDELYVAIRFSEGDTWLRAYNAQLATIRPIDFESRKVTLLAMNPDKYTALAKDYIEQRGFAVAHTKELGVVALIPDVSGSQSDAALATLLFALHYHNEVRLYSTFFKLKQVTPDFGRIVAETLSDDPNTYSHIAGQYVHWRIVQRRFGHLHDSDYPELFQPHVQPEDLRLEATEAMLALIDPELAFWNGLEYVGKQYGGVTVTFNLVDACVNFANRAGFKHASLRYFRGSLWNEILLRYLGAENLTRRVMVQLNDGVIEPEVTSF